MFYVYPEVLGTESTGLVIDSEGYRWSQRRPKDHWSFRGSMAIGDAQSLDELFKLEGKSFNHLPQQKFSKTTLGILEDHRPLWSMMLPKRDYLSHLKFLTSQLEDTFNSVQQHYYLQCWVPHYEVFASLRRLPAPDPMMFQENIPEAESFKPRGGWCNKIHYNRFGTRTGRLTITSGPQILTLRKAARKFLRSRWGNNGKLISIDFSALEVRLMMAELTGSVSEIDPYLELSETLNGELTREDSKLALISTVYGSTEHGLSGSLGVSLDRAREIHTTIQMKYGLKELIKRLRDQFMDLGFIRNRYGRRIEIADAGDGPLLNSYLQSTGVDVSLWGFLEIIKRLPEEHAVCVGLLHDSIIIDCSDEFFDRIGTQLRVSIPSYVGKFPLKISQFNL